MHPPASPLRIAVAAAPPLLADTLRTLLEDELTEITLLVDQPSTAFDVVIVTADLGLEVRAPVRIVLDESDRSTGGGTARLPGGVEVPLDDLTALLDFVRGLTTDAATLAAQPEG